MLSLSKHERITVSPFDKLRASGFILKRALRLGQDPLDPNAASSRHRVSASLAFALLLFLTASCRSSLVTSAMGGLFRDMSRAYSEEEDPDLVWAASPFALKTIDALLYSAPNDTTLLLAAASGYAQYAYGNLIQEADYIEEKDHERATELRRRAVRLLVRSRDFGLRGLEVARPGLRDRLRQNPVAAVADMKAGDAPLMYWTAGAWGAAIATAKDDSELTADQFIVEAMMRRVLAVDETYQLGSVHDFFIAYEGARIGVGGSAAKAEEHFRKALELSGGKRVGLYVTYAESVLLAGQKREEFVKFLEDALQIPIERIPDARLANTLAARRARWLLERVDDLFLEP